MDETKTENHKKCCIKTIGEKFEVKSFNESNFSYFFSNDTLIAKCRKHYSELFGLIPNTKTIRLGHTEYERGLIIEPEIYLDVVDVACIYDEKFCTSALIMKKLPVQSRMDNLFKRNSIPKDIGAIFKRKIYDLYSRANLAEKYDYVSRLNEGNARIIKLLNKNQGIDKKEKQYFLNEWIKVTRLTNSYKSLLNNQVINYKVKNLHGDLSWENIYYTDDLYLLDPCVAHEDMYKLDLLYQLVDPLVCFMARDCDFYVEEIIKNLKKENNELFNFYLKRHSLIRATVNFISVNNLYKKYLKVYDNQ